MLLLHLLTWLMVVTTDVVSSNFIGVQISATVSMLLLHLLTWLMAVTTDVGWASQGLHCNMSVQEILSDWDDTPWSCRTRCGESYSQQPCACDDRCQLYTDCCDDFTAFCLNTNRTSTADMADYDAGTSSLKNHTAAMSTENLMGTVRCRHRTKFISRCPNPPVPLNQTQLLYGGRRITQDDVVALCDTPLEEAEDADANQLMPVTDAASGHHFANVYCLLCHGGETEDAMPWSLRFVWRRILGGTPQDIRQFLQQARAGNVTTVAVPPANVTPRRCIPRRFFYEFECSCDNMARQCVTANTGVISMDRFDRYLFRHPSCAACFKVETNDEYEYKVKKPDIDYLMIRRNRLEFDIIMKQTSSSGDKTKIALKVDPSSKQIMKFPWQEMACDSDDIFSNLNGNGDDLTATFPKENAQETLNSREQMSKETLNNHEQMSKETLNNHEQMSKETLNNHKQMSEETLNNHEQMSEVKKSPISQTDKRLRSFNSSSFSSTTNGNTDADNSADADLGADRVNPQGIQSESTRDACTQRTCAFGIPLVGNKCRVDLYITKVHLLITCSKHDHFNSVPASDPGSTVSLQPAAIADMTRAIQLYFKTHGQFENFTVAGIRATRTQDGCLWNSTVSLHESIGLHNSDNMTLKIIEHVYQALLNVNRKPIDQISHSLHACGYVRRLSKFLVRGDFTADIPCFMRANYLPSTTAKMASAQGKIKTSMPNVVVGLLILLAIQDINAYE